MSDWPPNPDSFEAFLDHPDLYELQQRSQEKFAEVDSAFALRNLEKDTQLADVYVQARARAEDILRSKERMCVEDLARAMDEVEKPTDAIGNHRRVLELKQAGAPAEDIAKAETEAYWDSHLGFGEKMQKLRWDVPESRIFDIDDNGKILAGTLPLTEMYGSGITPTTTSVETARRINEYVNAEIFEALAQMPRSENEVYVIISLCPDDEATLKSSYVPEIKKMMVNFVSFFNDASGNKKMELQIGAISGLEISLDDVVNLQKELGSVEPDAVMDETDVLGVITPLPKDDFKQVTDVIRMMDAFDDKDLYMGEIVPADHPRDYDGEREISRQIYQRFENEVQQMNQYAYELAAKGVRAEVAQMLIDERQKKLARDICTLDPSQALITFSEASYRKFEALHRSYIDGNLEEAQKIEEDLDETLEDLLGCGGGSCDLYRELTPMEKALLKAEGIDADAINGYASCGNCGAKGLAQKGIGSSASFTCLSCKQSKTKKSDDDKDDVKLTWLEKQMGKSKDSVTQEVDDTPQPVNTLEARRIETERMQRQFGRETTQSHVASQSDVQLAV